MFLCGYIQSGTEFYHHLATSLLPMSHSQIPEFPFTATFPSFQHRMTPDWGFPVVAPIIGSATGYWLYQLYNSSISYQQSLQFLYWYSKSYENGERNWPKISVNEVVHVYRIGCRYQQVFVIHYQLLEYLLTTALCYRFCEVDATPLCEHLLAYAIVPQPLHLVNCKGWGVGLVDRKEFVARVGCFITRYHPYGRSW